MISLRTSPVPRSVCTSATVDVDEVLATPAINSRLSHQGFTENRISPRRSTSSTVSVATPSRRLATPSVHSHAQPPPHANNKSSAGRQQDDELFMHGPTCTVTGDHGVVCQVKLPHSDFLVA